MCKDEQYDKISSVCTCLQTQNALNQTKKQNASEYTRLKRVNAIKWRKLITVSAALL